MDNIKFGSLGRSVSEFQVVMYVVTSAVILMVATMCAIRVGASFPHDTLPRNVTLIVSILLQGVFLWICIKMSFPIAYGVIWGINKVRQCYGLPILSYQARDSEVRTGASYKHEAKSQEVNKASYDKECTEIFHESETKSQEEDEEFKKNRKEAVKKYICHAVAPILDESDMQVFWLEYEGWIDNPKYIPIGRNWKWKKNDVKHIDMRHLTWNIAKRMGMDRGYNIEVCGDFIKKLFPDLCKNVKSSTLARCLNADPNKGFVKIDEPDTKNPLAFHYEKVKNENENVAKTDAAM